MARDQQKAASEAANALSRAEAVLASADAELQRRREALATAGQRLGEREAQLQEAVARADHEVKGAGRDPRWSVQHMVIEIGRARRAR